MAELIGYLLGDLACVLIASVGLATPNMCADKLWTSQEVEWPAKAITVDPTWGRVPIEELEDLGLAEEWMAWQEPLFSVPVPPVGREPATVVYYMSFDGVAETPKLRLRCDGDNNWSGWTSTPGTLERPGMDALWIECGRWQGEVELTFRPNLPDWTPVVDCIDETGDWTSCYEDPTDGD